MEGERRRNHSSNGCEDKGNTENFSRGYSVESVTSNLQDSEFSANSADDKIRNQGNGGWLSGMGADFRNIAHCLTDNVAPVVSGVANIVHRTAVAVANEIAQLEHDEDSDIFDRLKPENELDEYESNYSAEIGEEGKPRSLMLPWEIQEETTTGNNDRIPVYFTDNALMQDILALSADEATFLQPFQENGVGCLNAKQTTDTSASSAKYNHQLLSVFSSTFVLDDRRIKLIQRLIDIDENLASMHSTFSGKSILKEERFWMNYFFHCEELRNERLGLSRSTVRSRTTAHEKLPAVIETTASKTDKELEGAPSSHACGENDKDEESLVPEDSASEADDSSYVIASAPNSVNTYTTSRSVDDLVVINASMESRGKR
ncbi:hypothetical protein IV203_011918 [Nitzschia inconspicua]|uniref:BSD domain-containing protein n=1 Tax=Nitzschia inconspicua TaxID=303405 RepID=A0A9K3KTM4_9STRA|nr:hypothetical protein IV203_011918 [Nitzschia inconspicua]